MSLSVCVRNVRAISQAGNITEGDMTCENIDILKSSGYTIEYLDGKPEPDSTVSSFEPTQEMEQVEQVEQIETVIIQEPEIQTLVIQQQDIFDNSLVLAETNATLKANNIELTNENNNLKEELENSITQLDVNKLKLEHRIQLVHSNISVAKQATTTHPRVDARRIAYTQWENSTKASEIELEKFANSLGLEYTRRDKIDGAPMYYTAPPIEEWVSYIPTSSATVREFN
tara:strand:- start:504 stop:1190 length:687 start_codon:yes stop_codon:yes gene_type:complete